MSTDIQTAPLRTETGSHQCRCVIVISGDRNIYCLSVVDTVDAPFCGACEDRHPLMTSQDGITGVTAWMSVTEPPQQTGS